MTKRNILVTGGSGFIGTHLCRTLMAKGHHLRVLDQSPPKNPLKHADYLEGDICNPATVENALHEIDFVYHLAAVVSVPVCQLQPIDSTQINLMGTLNILERMRLNKQKGTPYPKLVFASSAAVYGHKGKKHTGLKEEDVAETPLSFYGAQKLHSEQFIALFSMAFDLPALSFRFFNVYGPGQDPSSPYSGVISIFMKAACEGKSLELNGGGFQTRDFIYVEDLVEALALPLELKDSTLWKANPFNLGGGKSVSIRELAEIIKQLSNTALTLKDGPPREGDVIHSQADISRAKEKLGWVPKTPLADGLKKLYGDFFKTLPLGKAA